MLVLDQKTVLLKARSELKTLLEERKVDSSHGIEHADQVLNNMNKALSESKLELSEMRQLAMRLAALLHDANDRKYFQGEQNDLIILESVLRPEATESLEDHKQVDQLIWETREMISYVSAAQNGNSRTQWAQENPEVLWPRYCDRLEALGTVGIARCYLYNKNQTTRPLVTQTTPRATTEAEVWQYATEERFQQYQQTGASESMLSHYYDKLLRVALLDPEITQNDWIVQEALKRLKPMIDLCIEYGKTGELNVSKLEEYATHWEST